MSVGCSSSLGSFGMISSKPLRDAVVENGVLNRRRNCVRDPRVLVVLEMKAI